MGKLFAPIAERRGDTWALADEFGETSWRAFDQRVNRLIHALRAAGLETGDTFSVLSGNRREYVEAIAAAAQGGWRFVPVNWHWVADELAYVLENSDSKALLVDARFVQVAEEALKRPESPPLLLTAVMGGEAPRGFQSYESALAAASPEEPEDQSAGGPMFYTSGTTGRPKGVVGSSAKPGGPVELGALVAKALASWVGMPEDGVSLLEGPVYHSAQWAFSCLPMLTGSSLVMRHKFDAAETLELIDRYGVTNVHLVPTQFIRLLRLDEARRRSFDGSSLQLCLHGAAPCSEDVKRGMIEWWGPKISEYYGGTEGAVATIISAQEWLERPGSVGRSLDTVEIRIVKEDGSPADPGETGQIYMKNRLGIDFEYHKDPDKTKAAHLEPGVFTLGDVGYLDQEGYLFMSDRKIDMIISGGVNIYPAEIEGILVTHPAVVDAAVFGIPHPEFGEEVKAAVQLAEGSEPSQGLAAELMDHCRRHLASYKAPKSIDFETSHPRHPTGKLFKRLLREPYWKEVTRRI
jgi:long-chain acyl-CoA synthetase